MQSVEELSLAIRFASEIHRGQVRKGKDIPYITHPLAVAILISQCTSDSDSIIAGVLHDVIEDCKPYGAVTYGVLAELFGDRVADIVNDLTEPDKTLGWDERKAQALAHIQEMDQASQIVKSADILHNLTEIVIDIEAEGIAVFNKFNTSQEKTIFRYQQLLIALRQKWPENPLLPALEEQYQKLVSLTS